MEATEVKATGSFVEADKSDSVLSPANPAATTATEVDDVEVVAAAGAPKAVVAQGALAESAEEVQETVVVSGAGYDLDTDDYADEHIEIKHIETITGGDIAVTSTEASADKPASLEAGSVETKPAIATHADPVGHGDRPADGQTGEGTEAMNKKVVDDGLDGTNNEGGTNNEEANGDAKEDLLEAPGEAPRHASAASHSVGKSSEIGAFEELVQLLTIQAQALSMARTRTKARIVSAKRQLDDVLALLDGKDGVFSAVPTNQNRRPLKYLTHTLHTLARPPPVHSHLCRAPPCGLECPRTRKLPTSSCPDKMHTKAMHARQTSRRRICARACGLFGLGQLRPRPRPHSCPTQPARPRPAFVHWSHTAVARLVHRLEKTAHAALLPDHGTTSDVLPFLSNASDARSGLARLVARHIRQKLFDDVGDRRRCQLVQRVRPLNTLIASLSCRDLINERLDSTSLFPFRVGDQRPKSIHLFLAESRAV
eukprot:7382437-Prymnesium_polylepis.2